MEKSAVFTSIVKRKKSDFYSGLQCDHAYNLRHYSPSIFKINITILKSFRVTRCTKQKQSKQYCEHWKEIFLKIYFLQVCDKKTFRNSGFSGWVFQAPFRSYYRISRRRSNSAECTICDKIFNGK